MAMVRPCPARISTWSNVNVVFDGNSLVAGDGSSGGQTFPAQTVNLAPLSGSGATSSNVGIGGQSWADMTAGAADTDGAWNGARLNYLVLWETTNAIYNEGKNSSQVISDAQAYISARLAAHAWKILLMTSLPRWGTLSQDNTMVAVDNYFRDNFRAMGCHGIVDVRQAGGPFNFAGNSSSSFTAVQSLFFETSGWVHLNNAGYAVIAGWVAAAIRRMPR